MPVQHFSVDAISEPVVTIAWDFSYTEIDIVYRGRPLTRITDPVPLRTSGMHGTAPDGSTVVVYLRSDTWDGRFEVTWNGSPLVGAPILVAASSPVPSLATHGASRYEPLPGWQQYGPPGDSRQGAGLLHRTGPTAEQAKHMKAGRRWLTIQGGLSVLLGLVFWSAAGSPTTVPEDARVIQITAVIVVGIGALLLIFAAAAKGPRAKTVFGIAMVISALNLLAGLGSVVNGTGGGIFGVLVSAAATKAFYDAMKAAGAVNWSPQTSGPPPGP